MLQKIAYNTAGFALLALFSVLAIDYAFSTPVVVESFTTGECVTVENYPGAFFNTESNYTCENLPNKYTHVYAE